MSKAKKRRIHLILSVLGMCMVVCGCATSMESSMQGTNSTELGTLEASKEETLLMVNEPGAEELAEKKSPVNVMDVNAGWSEQVKQTISLPDEMYYLGCNENGYFFAEDVSENKYSDIGTYRYGFQYWTGETEILLEPLSCYYYTYRMCGDMLVLAVSVQGEEDATKVKIFRLQESEEATEILGQTKHTYPSLNDNGEELIAVIRDLDKETQATISKVVVYDLVTDEVEVIAEAEMSAYKNGERFVCAGGNDEDIYYVINRVGGDEIVRYSRADKTIVARCEMEYDVRFITGVGNMVIISESDEHYLEKAGYVGILSENAFEKVCEIPLVEADNGKTIREARVIGENLYFATPSAMYALKKEEGMINLYTYDCLEGDRDALVKEVLDVRADGIRSLDKDAGEIIHRFVP
ncbi:MAG: hypothetical protein II994_02445 [Lachnospiraceae bacterium]|nr:hypothetical protein [Lachnospiraceae bacterium]